MPTSSPHWTHESVRQLAVDDPIGVMIAKAREITFRAMEEGWTGPPFNPFELADFLGIPVVERDDIRDARLVPVGVAGLQIEFNPNRPKSRIRYSIAHELAHTLFPDCGNRVRNRADRTEMEADDWQLEMLCNIAASELLMPIGSFPDLRRFELSIDSLLDIRRKYEVSTEAVLLRFIRLTEHPCALFAASREEQGPYEGRYRIDYAIASSAWRHPISIGVHLRDSSIVSECIALGYTAKGREFWPASEMLIDVQCVGVMPYPGSAYPRVLGIAVVPDDVACPRNRILYLTGNATEPRGEMPQIIAHVMNNASPQWGGGFAKQLARTFSPAQVDYRTWAQQPGNLALGNTHIFGRKDGRQIATMVAQRGFGKSATPRISYPHLQQCLSTVAARALEDGASVHMPRIGTGQAGGKWEVVEELIEETLLRGGVRVTVYDLPKRGQTA